MERAKEDIAVKIVLLGEDGDTFLLSSLFRLNKVFPCYRISCNCILNFLSYSEMLAFTLTAFLELMDHGIVSWDMVSITFIKQVSLGKGGEWMLFLFVL